MKTLRFLSTILALVVMFSGCVTPQASYNYESVEAARLALPKLAKAEEAYFDGVAQSARDLAYTSDDLRSIAEVVRLRNQEKRDEFLVMLQTEKVMHPDIRRGYIAGFLRGETNQIMSFILEIRKQKQ